ncbi:MAG: Rab family GTPase [Candidatus Hodarchaeota archaeon]
MKKNKISEYLIKVSVIGSSRQLQTRFIRSFVGGKFTPDYLTAGCDISTKWIQVDSTNIQLLLFDISGKIIFNELRPKYYRGSSAALIGFDMGDRASFKAVEDWYKEFRQFIPHSTVSIALVGLITKLEKIITAEGQNLAEDLGIYYYETYIKDKNTIEGIFHDLAYKVLEKEV